MTAAGLLLWRHGRTAFNAQDRIQGQLDIPLDEVGRVQAKDAAGMLAAKLHGCPFRIVTSDLSRARETALALSEATGVPITVEARLREVHSGRWEGLNRAEVAADDSDLFAAWIAGEDVPVGGGERRGEAGRRTAEAIRRQAGEMDGGVLVAVSHGASLRGAVLCLLGVGDWSPGIIGSLGNAHWAELRRRGEAWLLDTYNAGPLLRGSAGLEG